MSTDSGGSMIRFFQISRKLHSEYSLFQPQRRRVRESLTSLICSQIEDDLIVHPKPKRETNPDTTESAANKDLIERMNPMDT